MTTSTPTQTTISKTEARASGGMVATKDVHATASGRSDAGDGRQRG